MILLVLMMNGRRMMRLRDWLLQLFLLFGERMRELMVLLFLLV